MDAVEGPFYVHRAINFGMVVGQPFMDFIGIVFCGLLHPFHFRTLTSPDDRFSRA